ncbi:hypothetical protein ACQP0C_29935 [Nocardia sp. CA-129566]|uniref:hypothetical protein n=1 Tax=Nocardia sp. CA-129566 TaxID=3239976 RepID=UPI003D96D3C1
MESSTLSLEAATYLGSADDGFGAIPRPFVKMVLDDNRTGPPRPCRTMHSSRMRRPRRSISLPYRSNTG